MIQEGLDSFFSIEKISVMGIIEPLLKLPELIKLRLQLKRYLLIKMDIIRLYQMEAIMLVFIGILLMLVIKNLLKQRMIILQMYICIYVVLQGLVSV